MKENINYYAFLGVSQNATVDEIKRAYVRKKRECTNNEELELMLNAAYDALCKKENRRKYNVFLRFGNEPEALKQLCFDSKDLEEQRTYALEARKIYIEILKMDSEDFDAIKTLVSFAIILNNEQEALGYISQAEKAILVIEDKKQQLEAWCWLANMYRVYEKIDEAIKVYYHVYQEDVSYVDHMINLAQLVYLDKGNTKVALQILNDCIARTTDDIAKIRYIYEAICAIRTLKNDSYDKVEETLYKKLENFLVENEEKKLQYAIIIGKCLTNALDREDFKCFHRLERIFEIYRVDNSRINDAFLSIQQFAKLKENGKIHEFIDLYFLEYKPKEIREKMGRFLLSDAAGIKESLDTIKKHAPKYWETQNELQKIESLVTEYLQISKEYRNLMADRTISSYMKTMIEYLHLRGFLRYEDIEDVFNSAKESFFEIEDKEKVKYTLRKMEEFYPISYKIFSDILFKGANVNQVLDIEQETKTTWGKKIIYGVIALFSFLLIGEALEGAEGVSEIFGLLVIFAVIRAAIRHRKVNKSKIDKNKEEFKKKSKKVLRWAGILFAVLVSISILGNIVSSLSEAAEEKKKVEERKKIELYNASHDGVLSKAELLDVEELDRLYSMYTDISIRYVQVDSDCEEEIQYPTEPDISYVWLGVTDYGYKSTMVLASNCLSETERAELIDAIEEVYATEDTDLKKCEQFYELAYSFVKEKEKVMVEVPNFVGMNIEEAYGIANDLDIYIGKKNLLYSSDYARDVVMYQYTEPGTKINKGDTIYVDLSLGEEIVKDIIETDDVDADTTTFTGPYVVNPDAFFELDARGHETLTLSDILTVLKVNSEDCDIISDRYYESDDYEALIFQYEASFCGVKGYVECVNENWNVVEGATYGKIYFAWYPYDVTDIEEVDAVLRNDSSYRRYGDSERIGPEDSIYISNNGNIFINRNSSGDYACVEFIKLLN